MCVKLARNTASSERSSEKAECERTPLSFYGFESNLVDCIGTISLFSPSGAGTLPNQVKVHFFQILFLQFKSSSSCFGYSCLTALCLKRLELDMHQRVEEINFTTITLDVQINVPILAHMTMVVNSIGQQLEAEPI